MKEVLLEDENGKVIVDRRSYKHIPVKNGDVVVLKWFEGLTTDIVDWFADELNKRGLKDCIVVVVKNLSDVKALDENHMASYGWRRDKDVLQT